MRLAHRARWAASALVVVACLTSALPEASAVTKKSSKRATTRRPTTRPVRATVPATTTPTTTAPTTTATTTAAPTTSPAPVTFERSVYSVTVASGGSVTLPLWLTIPKGFTGPITLRAAALNPETRITFDPNPARNYALATIANVGGSGALPIVQIEAVSATGVVVATAALSVFVVGGSTGGTVPVGSPNGGTGIVYSFPTPASPLLRGGKDITVPISITRQGGSTSAVTMVRIGALPDGMFSSFKFGTTLGDIDYLFVGANATTAPGTYIINVDAVSTFGTVRLNIPVTVA
jgi:hypothetical protein